MKDVNIVLDDNQIRKFSSEFVFQRNSSTKNIRFSPFRTFRKIILDEIEEILSYK